MVFLLSDRQFQNFISNIQRNYLRKDLFVKGGQFHKLVCEILCEIPFLGIKTVLNCLLYYCTGILFNLRLVL